MRSDTGIGAWTLLITISAALASGGCARPHQTRAAVGVAGGVLCLMGSVAMAAAKAADNHANEYDD
jgi:hypothetical protein